MGDGSVALCCEPATESAIFALGPRAGAEERLPRVLCPVVVAMGGRDAHDGPAVVSPGVARGVAHGRLERCAQLQAWHAMRLFLIRWWASRHEELGHLGPLEAPVASAECALALYRSLDAAEPKSRL